MAVTILTFKISHLPCLPIDHTPQHSNIPASPCSPMLPRCKHSSQQAYLQAALEEGSRPFASWPTTKTTTYQSRSRCRDNRYNAITFLLQLCVKMKVLRFKRTACQLKSNGYIFILHRTHPSPSKQLDVNAWCFCHSCTSTASCQFVQPSYCKCETGMRE